jgi:CxxC motif-containing protein (DUF1111 family)
MRHSLFLLSACVPNKEFRDSGELTLVAEDPSDSPFADLPKELEERFNQGDSAFELHHREATGLGPLYIKSSCGACHADDARGPGLVVRMVRMNGQLPHEDQSTLPWGTAERPLMAAGASLPILAPNDAEHRISQRQPPGVFGRGYMEAIPAEQIHAEARRQAEAGRVSGRVNTLCWAFPYSSDRLPEGTEGNCQVIGRFGLKAREASLDAFTADAYRGDMSITSEYLPEELPNPEGLTDDLLPGRDLPRESIELVADYMRLLDIPDRGTPDSAAERLFGDLGCAECHTTSYSTAPDWSLEPLAGRPAPIYSDLLLHDMGAAFSDGIQDAQASPSEWRTAPLMGLRFFRTYLHDGRASTLDEAIIMHAEPDSEAHFSGELYSNASPEERARLLSWLETL